MNNKKSNRLSWALALLIPVVAGCESQSATQVPAAQLPPAQVPTASYQELMKYVVDPTADDIWNAVSTTATKKGVVEKVPKTDEDWEALRRHSITLIEASNLLVIEGRPIVVGDGKTSEMPDELHADEIQKLFIEKRQQFVSNAALFRDAAKKVLEAVDARDVKRLEQTGAALDQACETCHSQFWYPGQKLPKAL